MPQAVFVKGQCYVSVIPGTPHCVLWETKAMQEVSHMPPIPTSQQCPAHHHQDQPLATHFIPFVAHCGGRQPNFFEFLFYKPSCSNSYSPFYTAQKPTCGYRYCCNTDHTRKVMDVSSANIVKWRPICGHKAVGESHKAQAMKPVTTVTSASH
uniref:Uncharacterized protein n=1 Tax=Falco tinnunculus TaxID=100819 RepID=A0A8C4TWD6_FALTI